VSETIAFNNDVRVLWVI